MDKLTIRPITQQTPELSEIKALYCRAFPENERRDFEALIRPRGDYLTFSGFWDGPTFVGFVCLLTSGDISHIIYFAVEEALRNQGYGGAILRQVAESRPGYRLLVDIEREYPGAPNNPQRARRKAFYLRHGYGETPVRYRWREEEYEILCSGGALTDEEFDAFWESLERQDPHPVGE